MKTDVKYRQMQRRHFLPHTFVTPQHILRLWFITSSSCIANILMLMSHLQTASRNWRFTLHQGYRFWLHMRQQFSLFSCAEISLKLWLFCKLVRIILAKLLLPPEFDSSLFHMMAIVRVIRKLADVRQNKIRTFLGLSNLSRLCLRPAPRRDSVHSAAPAALLPAAQECRLDTAGQQPLEALLCGVNVQNKSHGIQLRPYWIHRTATQPQPGHRRALVLRSRLHSLRCSHRQRRSLDHSHEVPQQRLLVRQKPQAPVLEGPRSQRARKSADDAGLQHAAAGALGDLDPTWHHAALRHRAVPPRRPLWGRWL